MANQTCQDATCHFKCSEPACLNLCRHMYSCKCYDYANGHIYKYLHALHMLNNQQHNSSNDKLKMLNEGMATILIQSPPDKENCGTGYLLVL